MSLYKLRMVSKITNIPVDTIRNWEKRYSFLKPVTNEYGEKLFCDKDIELLNQVSLLLKDGYRISEIAIKIEKNELLKSSNHGAESQISNELKLLIDDYYQSLILADLDKIEYCDSKIELMLSLQSRIDYIYDPLLECIGKAWSDGQIKVSQEHFSSNYIRQKLHAIVNGARYQRNTEKCSFIFSTPADELHEGGLLVLAASLKLKGYNTYYLGTNLSLSEVYDFAQYRQPAVVVLSTYKVSDIDLILKQFISSKFPVCVGGLGSRISEHIDLSGTVTFISQEGKHAVQRLEAIGLRYYSEFKKYN